MQASELRATPETLRFRPTSRRRRVALSWRRTFGAPPSSRRLPDETILAVYTALRPRRSSASELEEWAQRLDGWDAPLTAAFVRDALEVYAQRGLLAA